MHKNFEIPVYKEAIPPVLAERAICWIFCRSREAASRAVLEIFLVNIKSREAAPEPF